MQVSDHQRDGQSLSELMECYMLVLTSHVDLKNGSKMCRLLQWHAQVSGDCQLVEHCMLVLTLHADLKNGSNMCRLLQWHAQVSGGCQLVEHCINRSNM